MADSCINSSPITHFDIVIAGAGMVGSLLALSILKHSPTLQVLLLDANSQRSVEDQSASNPSFDARSIALSAGSIDILTELGLWQAVAQYAESIKQIEVSDRGHFGSLPLMAPSSAFGYVVELQKMGAVLAESLRGFSNLTVRYNTSISDFQQADEHNICEFSNGQTATCKLLVGADGTHSKIRELAKIHSELIDYQRSALICNVRTSQVHQNIAYERFTECGPIALLPMTEQRYSLVFCLKKEQVKYVQQLSERQFLDYLQQQFGYRTGIFESAGKRDIYSLSLLKTQRPVAHRVVCIGNAAHSLHPVAGQGFNLGFRDLYVLAKVVAASTPEQLGSYRMLSQYWQARQSDHHNTISMTDGLVRLFSNDDPLLSFARNIGTQAMSLFPALTQPIIKQAKGQFELLNTQQQSKESFL